MAFVKTNDPQVTVTGRIRPGTHTDLIVFSIPLAFFEIVCIVNIPPEGSDTAPVYVKFKTHRKAQAHVQSCVGAFEQERTRRFQGPDDRDDDDREEDMPAAG